MEWSGFDLDYSHKIPKYSFRVNVSVYVLCITQSRNGPNTCIFYNIKIKVKIVIKQF